MMGYVSILTVRLLSDVRSYGSQDAQSEVTENDGGHHTLDMVGHP